MFFYPLFYTILSILSSPEMLLPPYWVKCREHISNSCYLMSINRYPAWISISSTFPSIPHSNADKFPRLCRHLSRRGIWGAGGISSMSWPHGRTRTRSQGSDIRTSALSGYATDPQWSLYSANYSGVEYTQALHYRSTLNHYFSLKIYILCYSCH